MLRNEKNFYLVLRFYDRQPVAILKNNEFIGYFITDLFTDTTAPLKLKDTEEIPELFIEDESLLGPALFAWQKQTHTGNFRLCVFPTEPERLRLAVPTCETIDIQEIEMIRVNNWLPVLKACCRLKELTGKLSDSCHVLKLDGKNYKITVKDGRTDVQMTEEEPELELDGIKAVQTVFNPIISTVTDLNPMPELLPLPFVLAFTDKF